GGVTEVAWSPDGKSLAVGLSFLGTEHNPAEEGIDVYDVANWRVIETLPYSSDVSNLVWSPDSKKIAFSAAFHGAVWDLSKVGGQGTAASVYTLPEPGTVGEVAWSPD